MNTEYFSSDGGFPDAFGGEGSGSRLEKRADLADTGLPTSSDLAKIRVSLSPEALSKARGTQVTMSDTGLPSTLAARTTETSPEDMGKIFADPFGERTAPLLHQAQVRKIQDAIQNVNSVLDKLERSRLAKRAGRFKVGDRLTHRKSGAVAVVAEVGPYYYELDLGKGTTSIITLDGAAEYRLAHTY